MQRKMDLDINTLSGKCLWLSRWRRPPVSRGYKNRRNKSKRTELGKVTGKWTLYAGRLDVLFLELKYHLARTIKEIPQKGELLENILQVARFCHNSQQTSALSF